MATSSFYTPIITAATNEYLPAGVYNSQVRGNLNHLRSKVSVAATLGEDTSPIDASNGGTWTTLAMVGADDWDSVDLHEGDSRVLLDRPGVWLITAGCRFDTSTQGRFQMRLRLNNSKTLCRQDSQSLSVNGQMTLSTIHRSTVSTDYVELQVSNFLADEVPVLDSNGRTRVRAVFLGVDESNGSSWTAPTTQSTGTFASATWNQQVRDNLRHLHERPACRAYAVSAPGALGTGSSWVAVDLDGEDYDTDTMHSTSTNPSRVTLTRPGIWFVSAVSEAQQGAATVVNSTGLRIGVNGTGFRNAKIVDASGSGSTGFYNYFMNVSAIVFTSTTTDYVELEMRQDSSVSLVVGYGSSQTTHLCATWLGG